MTELPSREGSGHAPDGASTEGSKRIMDGSSAAKKAEKTLANRDDCGLGGVSTLITEVRHVQFGSTSIRSPASKAEASR